jgi:ribosomal protein S5
MLIVHMSLIVIVGQSEGTVGGGRGKEIMKTEYS